MFIVRLVDIKTDSVIKGKDGKDILFDVYSFVRYDKVNGLPSKENKDKWFKQEDSNYVVRLQPILIKGAYFKADVDFNGKLVNIQPALNETNIDLQGEFIDKYTR